LKIVTGLDFREKDFIQDSVRSKRNKE